VQGLPPLLVIGHPGHRRVTRFARAARDEGLAEPDVIAHARLLEHPERLLELDTGTRIVRIESLGQDDAVALRLLRLGRLDAERDGRCRTVSEDELGRDPPSGVELRAPRQLHYGIQRYMTSIAHVVAARPSWHFTISPSSVLTLFDKDETARRFAAEGIRVTDAVPDAPDAEALLASLRARGVERAYVKLRHGSSASGLAVVRVRARGGPPCTVWSTVARSGDRFFNSRRIQRYERWDDVRVVLGFLLAEGARVEPALPKARIGRRQVDLRVLVVGGDAVFVIARASAHPITNLHVGGTPCDPAPLRARMPARAWAAMIHDCERAADAVPAFQLGVDVLVAPSHEEHVVLEANAFGDLLNGVTIDGRDTYRHQLHVMRRALSGSASPLRA
jgi:hypothetical protein